MARAKTDSPQPDDNKTFERLNAEMRSPDIEEIVADIAAGKMVVLVDDEDRETEGDLAAAAEVVTPQAVNFMISEGKGLLCVPMTSEHAQELKFNPMVDSNEDDFGTAFTVSCDATADYGITTGISASDRASTINLLAKGGRPTDFHRHGHVLLLNALNKGLPTQRFRNRFRPHMLHQINNASSFQAGFSQKISAAVDTLSGSKK